jgi:polyisoprenoid-binding protein YceI
VLKDSYGRKQKMRFKKKASVFLFALTFLFPGNILAEENYVFDIEGTHAFIQFKVSHLGYSWIIGRFNKFDGSFSYDEKTGSLYNVKAVIDTVSIDSNHAERDKHLRGDEYLQAYRSPEAAFKSTGFQPTGKGEGLLKGELTLMGKKLPFTMKVTEVGSGKGPWGNFRRGFEGEGKLYIDTLNFQLRNSTPVVDIYVSIEGIRQKGAKHEEESEAPAWIN